MTLRRAFVFDPVCAQPFGHNVVALKYFSEKIGEFVDEVIPVASSALPDALAEKYGFARKFSYYYQDVMPLAQFRDARHTLTPVEIMGRMQARAIADAQEIIETYGISAEDAIVFPSVDYFGLVGTLDALAAIDERRLPKVFLRFIGVMETATLSDAEGLGILRQRLKHAMTRGVQIKIAAETPKYADYLADLFDCEVDLVPYPVHAPLSFGRSKERFSVFCPGSSRLDKGYLLLQNIFAEVRRVDPSLNIHFKVQSLPPREAVQHSRYTNQLYAVPAVTLLPSAISEQEMNQHYEEASLVLLPYDPAVYKLRGSAVLMECISRGKPVIALGGSAFCDQVQYYNAGVVVPSASDFARQIVHHYQADSRRLQRQSLQARHRFFSDSETAFDRWLAA